MVKLEEAVIARLESHGERFEILVDPDLAMKLKKGEEVDFEELLAADTVFKDSAKGEEASPETINKVFGTTELKAVVSKIIKDGEVQLTTEQRREMLEKKRKEVIDFISKNAVNPQNNTPHPPQRIENAMEEAKVSIDPLKSAKEQVPGIVKALKPLIPISMEQLSLAIRIPAEHSGKASSILHRYNLKKEEWQNDGSLVAVIEIPAGMKQELLNELNAVTHGELQTKILEK
jgi:ribosome maturation protein SDO1